MQVTILLRFFVSAVSLFHGPKTGARHTKRALSRVHTLNAGSSLRLRQTVASTVEERQTLWDQQVTIENPLKSRSIGAAALQLQLFLSPILLEERKKSH